MKKFTLWEVPAVNGEIVEPAKPQKTVFTCEDDKEKKWYYTHCRKHKLHTAISRFFVTEKEAYAEIGMALTNKQ